jgi:hypothetical protein
MSSACGRGRSRRANSGEMARWSRTVVTEGEDEDTALIALAVMVVGGALASMNNACKKSQHNWCAPTSSIRHHVKS